MYPGIVPKNRPELMSLPINKSPGPELIFLLFQDSLGETIEVLAPIFDAKA